MNEAEALRHDAAVAAALLILNEVDLTGCKAMVFGQIVFIITQALAEVERRTRNVGSPSRN